MLSILIRLTELFIFLLVVCHVFFFSSRRRHTRSTHDWSSDVCSSDLDDTLESWPIATWWLVITSPSAETNPPDPPSLKRTAARCTCSIHSGEGVKPYFSRRAWSEIGRASCRERGVVEAVASGGVEAQR